MPYANNGGTFPRCQEVSPPGRRSKFYTTALFFFHFSPRGGKERAAARAARNMLCRLGTTAASILVVVSFSYHSFSGRVFKIKLETFYTGSCGELIFICREEYSLFYFDDSEAAVVPSRQSMFRAALAAARSFPPLGEKWKKNRAVV